MDNNQPQLSVSLSRTSKEIPAVFTQEYISSKFADFSIPDNKLSQSVRTIPQFKSIRTVTAAITLTFNESVILANATSGAFTVTLPSAKYKGLVLHIKRINSGANAVTVSRGGTDTIEGFSSQSLTSQYSSITLYADGVSKWYTLAVT